MEHDGYHLPVMVSEVTDLLARRPGIYIDGTLGGGGHAFSVMSALRRSGFENDSLLIGIDQDSFALEEAAGRLRPFASRVRLERGNFSEMAVIIERIRLHEGCRLPVMGILLDLGVSSFQIDTPDRGFSYLRQGPLDMRMDPDGGWSAADIVNTAEESELAGIIYRYGEEKKSRAIARAIKARVREKGDFRETAELAAVVRSVVAGHDRQIKSLSRVFQALRIAVNDELGVLESALEDGTACLAPSGRMGVMSYHSLEDRMVKRFFRDKSEDDWGPKGVGLREPLRSAGFKLVTRKSVVASDDEVRINPRARSARLRVIEKKELEGESHDRVYQ